MKKSKIIIPALAMMVMSTAATVTGTVAWFSMNKFVNATGMSVRASADSSLLIKGLTNSSDTKFSSVGTNNLQEETMKPCTSFDGVTFGYLSESVVVASENESTATWSGTDGAFNPTDIVTVGSTGKVSTTTYFAISEYAVKCLENNKDIYVEDITVTTSNAGFKALRIAVEFQASTYIYNPYITSTYNDGKVGKYSDSAWSLAASNTITWATKGETKIGTLTKTSTSDNTGTKIIVRLWFEGQDSTCSSDKVDANAFSVSIKFRGDDSTGA